MATLSSFDQQNRPTQKQFNLDNNTRKPSSSITSSSDEFSSDSHESAPDVTRQDLYQFERMESEGGPVPSSRHHISHSQRYDISRRGSTGSAKADDEFHRDLAGNKPNRRHSDVDVDVQPNSKLKLQTEELETSGMSEMEIAELARKRAEEQPNIPTDSNGKFHQPIPGLSYASVVKDSAPSQGPDSSIAESILSRQAAEAVQLDHRQRQIEKQMEIEQVKKKEDLLVPPTPLQHPIVPVLLNPQQAKSFNEMNQNTKQQGGIGKEEQQGGGSKIKERADKAEGLKEKAMVLKDAVGEETRQLKSSLNNTLDQLSSSVSGASSPIQKGRETLSNALSSVSETVKSKLPWFGSSKAENEEEGQEEEDEEQEQAEEQDDQEGKESKSSVASTSTFEQLKNQASHLTSVASNKVSQLLPENLLPSSLKSGSTNASPSKSFEKGEGMASSKANQLKGKVQKQANEFKNQSDQVKNQAVGQAGGLKNRAAEIKNQVTDQASGLMNRGAEMKEEVMKKTGQSLEQGKQMWDQGKQVASKKLEEGKQMAGEKVNQAKQLAHQANQSMKQMAGKGLEKGQQAKQKASEMINKQDYEEEETVENESAAKLSSASSAPSTLSSLSPNWHQLLSSITGRASHLKQQAAETASQLSDKASEKIPSLSSLKSSGNEMMESGKKQLKQVKQQLPATEQAWEVVGKGKKKLNKLKNQTADSLGHLKEQGLAAAESSGIMDQDHKLNLRDSIQSTLSNLSHKIQGKSQFQSLSRSASPYISRTQSFGSNYLHSYQDFLSTLRDQNYLLQLVFGLMAVMHVFIPLLFLDYPQARMCIKWYSFVAILSHALWYFTRSIKLVQLPNILLYPLITYLLMMSPMMGEGLNSGTQSVISYLSDWLSFLAIPIQARSYFFTLWLRTLLMLDTAVLTWNMMGLSSFINKNGGSIKQACASFLQSDEGKTLKKKAKEIKKIKGKFLKGVQEDSEQGEEEQQDHNQDQDQDQNQNQNQGHEKRRGQQGEEQESEEERLHLQQRLKKQPKMSKAKKSSPTPAPKVSAPKQNKKSSFNKRDKQSEHDQFQQQQEERDDSSFSEEEHEQHPQSQHQQHQQQHQHQAPATKMKMKKKKSTKPQQQEEEQDQFLRSESQSDSQFESQSESQSPSESESQSSSRQFSSESSPSSSKNQSTSQSSSGGGMKKKDESLDSRESSDSEEPIENDYDDRDRDERRVEQGDDQSHERPDLMKWENDPAPLTKKERSAEKSELHHDHNADWSSGSGMTLSGDAAAMAMQDWSMAK